jgi:uncharacterized protein (UPF0297 family)
MRNYKSMLRDIPKEHRAANVMRHTSRRELIEQRIRVDNLHTDNVIMYGVESKSELANLASNHDCVRLADTEFHTKTNGMEYRLFAQRDDQGQAMLIERLAASKELRHLSAIEQRARAKAMLRELMRQANLKPFKGRHSSDDIKRQCDAANYVLSKDDASFIPSDNVARDLVAKRDNMLRNIKLPSSIGMEPTVQRKRPVMPDRYRVGGTIEISDKDKQRYAETVFKGGYKQRVALDATQWED